MLGLIKFLHHLTAQRFEREQFLSPFAFVPRQNCNLRSVLAATPTRQYLRGNLYRTPNKIKKPQTSLRGEKWHRSWEITNNKF